MEKPRVISIMVFVILLCQVLVVFAQENPGKAFHEMNSGGMLGIHFFELKEGVEPAVFEAFVRNEFDPVMRGLFPGVEIKFMKGEKGPKVDSYILVYDIQSLFVRNYYWPKGGPRDESDRITGKCGETCEKIWTRMQEMVSRSGWADYIDIAKNNLVQ